MTGLAYVIEANRNEEPLVLTVVARRTAADITETMYQTQLMQQHTGRSPRVVRPAEAPVVNKARRALQHQAAF